MDIIERAFTESLYVLGAQLLIRYHCHCFRIDVQYLLLMRGNYARKQLKRNIMND